LTAILSRYYELKSEIKPHFLSTSVFIKKEKTEIVHERGFLDLTSMKLNLPPEKEVRELTDL
jgi:hypothetical protein